MKIVVAVFTGSKNISSRRFRVFQYIELLKRQDIHFFEHYSFFGSWPPVKIVYRPFWLFLTLLERIIPIIKSYRCDIVFFQRELVSTLLTLEVFTKRPRILDVDDAIWLQNNRAKKNFIRLVQQCDGIICGNNFIYTSLKMFNPNCIIIPTSVDTKRFLPSSSASINPVKIIGWSGLSSGFKYLYDIEDEIFNILNFYDFVRLRIISDAEPRFKKIPSNKLEYIRWTPENEVSTIQDMTIGIMPIDNSEWSKGKCSYKMLLYMSCSIPVIVSNAGMNIEVLSKGKVGFGVSKMSEWGKYLKILLNDQLLAKEMGINGRNVVEEYFSIEANSLILSGFIKSTLTRK
jgi:glycosyltransferase involved in cell wall biosynthesis